MAVLFWVLIAVFCFGVEVHTNAFVALFLGVGAAISFILALAGVPFLVQVLASLGVSGATLIFIRPFALRRFHHRPYEIDMSRPTSITMTDLRGVVLQTVGDERHPGKVKIQGESWRAVTDWPESIPDGAMIVVRKAFGTTLWVDPESTSH
ncbi:MAG: NfeD family protein [Acidimicrobiales bacterium]|jgi:membrane protein implicated in regulation of membrane protease activity